MKIYEQEGFPNPVRVRIALAEKGVTDEATFVPVDVMAGEHRGEAFRAINPDATVPCLQFDDGATLSQCNAIINYIDEAYDGPSLTGQDPRERAHITMMNLRAEAGFLDAIATYFHHATPGLGPDLETDQTPEWGEKQKKRALATMKYFNDVLEEHPYLAGEKFTVADITAYAGIVFAGFANIEIPEDLTHFRAWKDRVEARPSIAA